MAIQKPNIKTFKSVIPMIYAYTTPEIARHDGWTKIGYTEQDVITRIEQQTHTADIKYNLEWKGNAIYDDGSGERFTDKDFHSYLRKSGVEQESGKNNEWFHITGPDSKIKFQDFRSDRGLIDSKAEVIPYNLREEQLKAVTDTLAYMNNNPEGEFLWNAKPRFGKTLATYDFCVKAGANTVLIVTNRPAIANSWHDDYMKFFGIQSGYLFVSEVDALKGKPGVLTRNDYMDTLSSGDEEMCKCIEFVSLQNLKGSKYFSADGIDKLKEVAEMYWDILVIDEAHEGVDTYKTDVAFDQIKRGFTLHLSGTPFKALANNKFEDNAIFNWTYADEQRRKIEWDNSLEQGNPYKNLPKLNLYTYQMSEIIKDELSKGIEIDEDTVEYAFDLNEFFKVENGRFVYNESVDKFLDALTLQMKFPFSTPELRAELKHTFWLLNRVDSAKLLAKKLENHPVFKDYKIVLAAGDGKLDDEEEYKKSYDKVVDAISENDKTITLSVGQLTTGVTIPEWSAVLMLSNVKSPSLYMQAAFRAQNPCIFKEGFEYRRKQNAYVFDFDPARTLNIFEEFANDLCTNTSAGKGDIEERKSNVKELLNFFPVIGEDENGELIELDAEKVLTIPRKIRSVEVVKRGFICNFLFQNISQIFSAPKEVRDILEKITPAKEDNSKDKKIEADNTTCEKLSLNDENEVELSDKMVIGISKEVFGDKIYAPTDEVIVETARCINKEPDNKVKYTEKLINNLKESVVTPIVDIAKDNYGSDLKRSEQKRLEIELNKKGSDIVKKAVETYSINQNSVEQEKCDALQNRHETGKSTDEIEREYEDKYKEIQDSFVNNLKKSFDEFKEESKNTVVETVETSVREKEKKSIEDDVRDHLRGFSRTIPSFLMAYGSNEVTLKNFDQLIPEDVFKEVTSITLEQFRFLRDGGSYIDEVTGEEKHFNGNLFDPVVFDDSVKEFMTLKKKLSNYFDEENEEDIFDYIPPQKTNQIFTPKNIVIKMVDMLEEENPGCFDNPDKTFADLYMKSGMYITEIVKRLYQSNHMREVFPNADERLKHIFEKQVYGLAPTEIIYRICLSYILGFAGDIDIEKHNIKLCDTLKFAQSGTLEDELSKLFPEL